MDRIDRDKRFIVITAIIGAVVLVLQGFNAYTNIKKNKRETERLDLEREKDRVVDNLALLQAQKTQLEIVKLNEQVPAKYRIPEASYLQQPQKPTISY